MKEKIAANTGFRPPEKNALAFDPERGKLYKFTAERIEVVRLGQPYPAAYLKKARTGIWQNQLPKAQFPWLFHRPIPILPKVQSEALQRYLAFTRVLYDDVAACVGEEQVALLERFDKRSWFLYCLLVHGGDRALDLTRSNPSLAWLLSAHAVYHPLAGKRYWRSVRSLLDKKRRDILGYFGFPSSEAAVKLFARIRPGSCATDLFFILRKQLRESPELLRQLSFFPLHNSTSLRIICSKLRPHFSFHALSGIAALEPGQGETELSQLRDILRMRSALEAGGTPPPWFHIRSLSDLDAVHNELVDQLNKFDPTQDLAFGESPLPDVRRASVWIEGIRRSSELHREGRDMRHCIYSYHDLIASGEYFVARMLVPERLTILCRAVSDRFSGATELELVEARGLRNELPGANSLRLIRHWLQRNDLTAWDPDQLTIFDGWDPGELPLEAGSAEL